MNKGKISAIVLLIVSSVILVRYFVFPIVVIGASFYSTQNSASMGIIGGADGPTAILVSSSLWGSGIFYIVMTALGLAAFIASIVYLVKLGRKNKNQE